MKASEIRNMTTKDILERIAEDRSMLTRHKLNHAISPLDNPMQIKQLRRDIARLKTEIRQRELAENK